MKIPFKLKHDVIKGKSAWMPEYEYWHEPQKKPWWQFWDTEEERTNKIYLEGYDFAAGSLLRGKSIKELMSIVNCSKSFGDMDTFDNGIVLAIQDFKEAKLASLIQDE